MMTEMMVEKVTEKVTEMVAGMMTEKLAEMVAGLDIYRQSKGELPPSLDIGVNADHAHNTYLVKKYGPDYKHVEC